MSSFGIHEPRPRARGSRDPQERVGPQRGLLPLISSRMAATEGGVNITSKIPTKPMIGRVQSVARLVASEIRHSNNSLWKES